MDARVDDFLNEINEIVPIKEKKSTCVWQECYDDGSGFCYYWNTVTDEVTWEKPKDYKDGKDSPGEKRHKKSTKSMYIPPKTHAGSVTKSSVGNDAVKIYKVPDNTQKYQSSHQKIVKKTKTDSSRKHRPSSDSEDEKIVLISSYGGDTESEEDEDVKQENSTQYKPESTTNSTTPPLPGISKACSNSDEKDAIEDDIVSKIQKRAKELKALGGQLPPGVEKIVEKPSETLKADDVKAKPKKHISGFSLVAGYGESDEEQDTPEPKPLFAITGPHVAPETKVSHSPLFPISMPVDIRDFPAAPQQPAPSAPVISPLAEFGTKMFQRKRRIGIDLVNTKKPKSQQQTEEKQEESEHKGLGFSGGGGGSGGNQLGSTNVYPGFKSGGIMFVKSDVLQPSVPNKGEVEGSDQTKDEQEDDKVNISKRDVIDTYTTLMEKLGFLNEGRPEVSPVQAMIIQIETLHTAMKNGGLKLTYLDKWLKETCADLIKLEKEATPEGWLLHWDRSHKRYYYQNQHTADCQWEYPQQDVVRCDEAMDICTTPPPCPTPASGPAGEADMSPPVPPTIRSPSPPPPPIISQSEEEERLGASETSLCSVPLPPPPPSTKNGDQPLPPGVDNKEESSSQQKESEFADTSLSSALDSFYSDIAALENSNSPKPSETPACEEPRPPPSPSPLPVDTAVSEPPKKKKKKTKLAEGLAMKKKGVSKLVEKWKTVQMSLNE